MLANLTQGMGVQINEASQRIDECLLRFMDQLELLEEKRERLNSLIEQGWFSISKARYSMGNKQVSTLQYGNEIEPQVQINVRLLENGEAEFDAQRVECLRSQHLEKDLGRVEDIGPKDEGVRRRGVTKEENPKDQPAAPRACVSRETSPPNQGMSQHQDPLKWFGILVPQSLKQAQASFKKVVELSAEVATLQCTVVATRKELQALMGNKQEETQSTEADKQKDTGNVRQSEEESASDS
ncbi:coiled-coil domain-containing protein 115 [Conger conger]|uniref:coiled-coil domain-containing protein 115 n=1 Tax=Conger conger TaxID=82655 RepID=UPI002A59F5C4|nr:coiled-coil domain-containing protein 115 [Conger conger]